MGLTLPVSTEWIADSGASFHTTPDAGILCFRLTRWFSHRYLSVLFLQVFPAHRHCFR